MYNSTTSSKKLAALLTHLLLTHQRDDGLHILLYRNLIFPKIPLEMPRI